MCGVIECMPSGSGFFARVVGVEAASCVSSDFMFLLFVCELAKAFRCLTNQSSDFGQTGQFFSTLSFARLGAEGEGQTRGSCGEAGSRGFEKGFGKRLIERQT